MISKNPPFTINSLKQISWAQCDSQYTCGVHENEKLSRIISVKRKGAVVYERQ